MVRVRVRDMGRDADGIKTGNGVCFSYVHLHVNHSSGSGCCTSTGTPSHDISSSLQCTTHLCDIVRVWSRVRHGLGSCRVGGG